jgi:response regulator NasT
MKRKVLVIDDHLPSKTALMKALVERGFEVVGEGSDSRAARALARTTFPDLILMAVGLPDPDGIAAAQAIMEKNPLPIVLLTSHYDAATIERAKEAGVMAYLIKPLREEELVPTVELAISRFEEFISVKKENQDLKKTLEARKSIERAKGILMKTQGLSEAQAFSLIQKKSMDLRKPMAEIAQAIVLTDEMTREGSS